MNFKPNVNKVAVSIIIAILIWALFDTRTAYLIGSKMPLFYDNPLWPFLALILTYLIWSLLQKKEVVDKKKRLKSKK